MNRLPIVLAVLFALSDRSPAQEAAKPAAQTFTGCVARIQSTADKYVLATGDRCMLIAGAYDAGLIADHEIMAQGILIEPSGMEPLTLNIHSVQSVKAACTRTCVLEPPGTRGIHGKERPGKEGGTPGLKTPPSPTPQANQMK